MPSAHIQDFTWTWMSEPIIRESALDLFKQHHVTGYTTRTVRARLKRGAIRTAADSKDASIRAMATDEDIPGLHELVVTGSAGVLPLATGAIVESYCAGCGRTKFNNLVHKAEIFDSSQWDGSDIFTIWPLTRFIFVTDRVAALMRSAKLGGFQLISLEEMHSLSSGFSGLLNSREASENIQREAKARFRLDSMKSTP